MKKKMKLVRNRNKRERSNPRQREEGRKRTVVKQQSKWFFNVHVSGDKTARKKRGRDVKKRASEM